MTRKIAVLAVAALMVAGTSAALAAGDGPTAADDPVLAQETTTVADNETAEETTAQQMTTTAAEGMVAADTASVTFLNQTAGFTFTEGTPNTTTVIMERVVVPEGGFLVVHEAQNVSGEYASADNVSVGGVVGNSTYLEPGVHSNVVVELNETIDESQTLVAMPHKDTNDNQQYDFPEADAPYTMDGSPVIDTGFVIIDYNVIEGIGGEGTTTANETTTAGM